MFGFVLDVLALLLLALVVVAVAVAGLAALGVVAAGAFMERVFDLLVPSRTTGVGAEGLVGAIAEVVATFEVRSPGEGAEGNVRVAGETWRARCADFDRPAVKERVRITGVEGLTVTVTRLRS